MKQLYIFILFISFFGFGQNAEKVVSQNIEKELRSLQPNTKSEGIKFADPIRFYPNPIKNNTLRFNNVEDTEIRIYDVLGKLVKIEQLKTNNASINISNLNKGIYLVNISGSYGSSTKKLIRQ